MSRRWFNLLRITLITLTKFLSLAWLFIILFRNGLIIVFYQILLLNRNWCNLSLSSTSPSLRNFWFHALVFFLTRLELASGFWCFVNIISYQSMIITFISLFLRSVLTSQWLAFNISCTSTRNTFLNVTRPRFIGLHRLGPLFDALRQFEASLLNFILI